MIKELSAGDSRARIVPDCGMNCMELVLRGKSVLRRISGEEELRADPNVYGTPLLLPANRTAGGRFRFEGRDYELGINEPKFGNFLHGSLSSARFRVVSETETELEAVYENRGGIYPFPFDLRVRCALSDGEYRQTVTIRNTGERAMPVCFAVHTAFNEDGCFDVPIDKAHVLGEGYIPTGSLRELNDMERTIVTGTTPSGKVISGFYTPKGHVAHVGGTLYRVSENFNQWVLWNQGGDKGFICVEPQCGAVNCLNSGDGLLVLQPGSHEEFSLSFSLCTQT